MEGDCTFGGKKICEGAVTKVGVGLTYNDSGPNIKKIRLRLQWISVQVRIREDRIRILGCKCWVLNVLAYFFLLVLVLPDRELM